MPHNNIYLSALDKSKLEEIKKVELAKTKKVHLNAVDDANKLIDQISESRREMDDLYDSAEEVDTEIREMNNKGNKVYEDLNSAIENTYDLVGEAFIVLSRLEDGAKSLGIDPREIEVYRDLTEVTREAEGNVDASRDTADNLGDLIGR